MWESALKNINEELPKVGQLIVMGLAVWVLMLLAVLAAVSVE
jgi:hypothetical protein